MSRWMSFRSAALASLLVLIPAAARADVTITLTNRTFTSLEFLAGVDYSQFNLSGTLTGVTINMTLTASSAGTLTSPEAVSEWDFLVAQGHTPRDVIKSPLNGTPANYSVADEFACNFSMGSYQFKYLVVAHGGNYPRKTKV